MKLKTLIISMKIKHSIATCFGILLTSLLGVVSSTSAKSIIPESTSSHIIVAQSQQRIRYESVNAAFKGKYTDVFILKTSGKWVEHDENGKTILWNEISRNSEHVMLFNPKSGTYVRLEDGIYFFKSFKTGERWIGYSGKWIK
jgi:hypothetical protein